RSGSCKRSRICSSPAAWPRSASPPRYSGRSRSCPPGSCTRTSSALRRGKLVMSRIRSERLATRWLFVPVLLLAGMAGVAPVLDKPLAGQDVRIMSSQVAVSRDDAELTIEIDGRQPIRIALRNGVIEIDGARAGSYDRDGRLDRAWRNLLNDAMNASGEELAALLANWEAPEGEAGARVSEALAA